MPTPSVTAVGALISDLGADPGFPSSNWTGWGTGGGNSDTSLNERAVGSNSAAAIAGVLYVVVRTSSATFQVFKSADAGVTWATSGSALTPTDSGGGICTLVIGTDLYVAYSRGRAPGHTANANSRFVFLAIFDTVGETWGAEDSFDCSVDATVGASFVVEGPFVAHVRPDDTIVFLIEETIGADACAVVYASGVWAGPFRLTPATFGTAKLFDSSVMLADGTVDLFLTATPPYDPYHAIFHADNSVTAPVLMSFTGQVLDWAGDGLYYGYEDAGTYFLAAGKKTATPGIFGRPAILYGNDGGGWTLGQLLDAGFDADFSVYSSSLQRVNGMLVFTWRGVSSNGADFVERIGWAPEGSHDTPADWTFATAYDYRSPSPGVSGRTGPYKGGFPPTQSGASAGLILDGSRIHFVVTLRDATGELFSTYLLFVDIPTGTVIVNEFRVGRSYCSQ